MDMRVMTPSNFQIHKKDKDKYKMEMFKTHKNNNNNNNNLKEMMDSNNKKYHLQLHPLLQYRHKHPVLNQIIIIIITARNIIEVMLRFNKKI